MTEGINVLSLFDGMSCGQIALEKIGIKVNKYYSSEIDKYAIQVTQDNYPNTIQLGDIRTLNSDNLAKIDLLIGGSPCQGFSFAGKQLNFSDPRSALFFEFVRLLKECKPKYFLLENVKMKQVNIDIISKYLKVHPIEINSALVSAQSRKRLYWTNIPNVSQPKDQNVYLYNILEDGFTDREKAHCIDANYFKGGNLKSYFKKRRRQLIFSKNELLHVGMADLKGKDSLKRVYDPLGKSPTLTSMNGGNREPKILCGAWRGRYTINGIRQDGKMKTAGLTTQRLEVRTDQKTNTLSTIQKDNNIIDIDKLSWRKLTPLECERLQTVPDGYTKAVSNTQRYKMLGNGWTVKVIMNIFKGLNNELKLKKISKEKVEEKIVIYK